MPFYKVYGTSAGGGGKTGWWGGVLLRDVVTSYVNGAWEYEVEFSTSDGFSNNLTYDLVTRNDTLVAFWLDSQWFDPADHGYLRLAPINDTVNGWAWPKNITYLEIHPTNTSAVPRSWDIAVEGYRDDVLAWDEYIHQGFREVKYGWIKSTQEDPGYYIGCSMKNLLDAYVGPWTEYSVTLTAVDGFNMTADWALASSDDWFFTYGVNGSAYSDLSTSGWVRMMSLNDTSAQAGKRSIKNITKIEITPLAVAADVQWNLTLTNETGVVAFYTPLNLTTMDYFEGPLQAFRGYAPMYPKGLYILKGVNFSYLLEQHFTLNEEIELFFTAHDGFATEANFTDFFNNETHTTILAWEIDGGHVDHTNDENERALLMGMMSHDPTHIPKLLLYFTSYTLTYYIGEISVHGAGGEPPILCLSPLCGYELYFAGGLGVLVVIAIGVWYFKKK
jgi:hypothetical protein